MTGKSFKSDFNGRVSAVIDGLMSLKGVGREGAAEISGLGFPKFDANMRGRTKIGWTAGEFVAVVKALDPEADPGELLETAIKELGGYEKVIAEQRAMSEERASKKVKPKANPKEEQPKDADVVEMFPRVRQSAKGKAALTGGEKSPNQE